MDSREVSVHDAAAVEALAKEVRRIRNEAHGCDYPSDSADVAVANAILAREAALVEALERIARGAMSTCYAMDEAASALAAHRAASAPKEPTLAEAVEAYCDRVEHTAMNTLPTAELRAALARERQQVTP